MGARRFNKRIEIWQTSTVSDGFSGNKDTDGIKITSSWAHIKTMGVNSKYASRNTSLGTTTTTNGIVIQLRKRNDIIYNSINQYIKYNGVEYIIQNEPLEVDFEKNIIEIVAVRENLESVTEITPIT